MKTWNAVKLYGMLGLAFGATSNCTSSRIGSDINERDIISTDTFRVAHVRYTPDGDYVNLEFIKNGRATEQYNEITVAPESETTFFGDTILLHHTNKLDKIVNISAMRRTRQK